MTKIILTFLLVSFSSLFANESWLYKSETLENGAIRVVIDGLKVDDGFREGAERDWIAVYPKNASNAWENVIDWRWADFTPYKKGGRYHLYDGATRIKKLGEYQVRFFRNNSFKLYKAFDFRIIKKSPNSPLLFYSSNFLYMKGFIKNVLTAGPTDWVGIYKVNDNNNWDNVIEWRWAKEMHWDGNDAYQSMHLNLQKYSENEKYEARYFLNNSYITQTKSKPFSIEKSKHSVTKLSANTEDKNHPKIIISGFIKNVVAPAPKDWIGIYKKDDDNSWSNVIEWIWAKDTSFDGNNHYRIMHLNPRKYSLNEKYEARYFLNNSFTTHMKSKPFSTESSNNQISVTEIKGNYQNGRIRFNIYPRGIAKLKYGAKDWVGLYRKGTSNDWNNVLTWGWVKEFEDVDKGVFQLVKSIHLQKGKYDVRYFRDNSFITYKDSTFKVR